MSCTCYMGIWDLSICVIIKISNFFPLNVYSLYIESVDFILKIIQLIFDGAVQWIVKNCMSSC